MGLQSNVVKRKHQYFYSIKKHKQHGVIFFWHIRGGILLKDKSPYDDKKIDKFKRCFRPKKIKQIPLNLAQINPQLIYLKKRSQL